MAGKYNQNSLSNNILGISLICSYTLAVLLPVLLVAALDGHQPNFWEELGKSCALIAFPILFLQPVLAARFHFLDRVFGLDSILLFHRSMGILAFCLLVVHPLFIALGMNDLLWLLQLNLPWNIWLGKIALFLLILHIVFAVFRRALHMPFEWWRALHDLFGVSILVLVFIHSWVTGSDLDLRSMRGLWLLFGVVGVGAFVWHRLVMPWKLSHDLSDIIEVKQETHDTRTIRFSKGESYAPGQFHFLRFLSEDISPEEHHFTISGGNTSGGEVTSTIKESGDFTSRLGKLQEGDKAMIQGPYGSFSYTFYPEEKDFVFIAGGIGITPLMSMLRHMRDTHFDGRVLLLYANKTQKDIVFRDELSEMESSDLNLKVVHVLSEEKGSWEGETGHIDKEKIEKYVGSDLKSRYYYLCGPAPMNESVVGVLRERDVPLTHIHGESFSILVDFSPTTARKRKRQCVIGVLVTVFVAAAIVSALLSRF